MTAILNVLVEVTVYSAILFGAVLLFQKLFHKHISAALNYAVWVLLIVRLIMPVTIDSGFHFFVMPEAPPQVQTDTVNNASNNALNQAGLFLPVQQTIADTSFEVATGNGSNPASNDNQNLSAPWKIDWQTALVLAWGAGVIGSFTVMAVLWRRLGQKIKRYGSAAPEYVLKLVDECKNDMGIQANIEVLVQGWLKSPALSTSLKPKLLLPEHMLHTMDAQQLEFGIRHELMHYRRKDHIMNILLMVLRCVYWFNPVVYIAFRRIQIDMETACDASITSRLESPERTSYIRTMIDLSGSSDTQYILGMGMGMGMGRKAIEKRIRGMFMKKKTGASVRTAAFVLAGILAVTCFTTACQPTPEKPVVVNKNDSALSDNIMAPPASAATYSAPASVKDAFTAKDSHVTVNIDAAVTVPNVSAFPVVQIQPDKFTNDFVKKAAEVLFEGKTAYEPRTQMTKAEIEKEILELQHALADPKNSGSDGLMSGNADIIAETTQMFKDRIKNYQALLATAPEKVTAQESDFQFHPAKTYEDPALNKELNDVLSGGDIQAKEILDVNENTQKLIADATLDNGYYGRIEASNYNGSTMMDNSLCFLKSKTLHPSIEVGPTYGFDAKIPPTSLSQDDAIRMSQDLLNRLGIADMALTSCSTITSDSLVLNTVDTLAYQSQAAGNQPDEKCGYSLAYQRTYGGIPTMSANTLYETGGDRRLSHDNQYGPFYQHEYIQITIYGDQIVSFIWKSPSKEVQTENANVELKPFEDILGAFKQQMIVEYTLEKLYHIEAFDQDYKDYIAKMESGHVDISKIGLEMVRIQIKDKPGEYRMVPAWKFYGNEKIKWKDGQEEEQANMAGIIGNPLTVCQTINAIDGSIIDEKLGY